MASAGQDALTKCREMNASARTYRVGANGYGAGAGLVATMGCASRDDWYVARDDKYATRDDGYAARDDEYAARDDG